MTWEKLEIARSDLYQGYEVRLDLDEYKE